jgi:uncharacterized protein (TIGR00730 family)
MRRLCVFCGSSAGKRDEYRDSARQLGELLAARGIGIVTGGGHIGLMGVVADAALAGGGEVIGVIPQALVDRELAHGGLTRLEVVASMHGRKAAMADLADGFAALPGGYGTCDELFEILTWAQLGLHTRPVGLLDTAGYFTPMLAWLDHMVAEGFLKAKHRGLLIDARTPEELLNRLLTYRPPEPTPKWIEPADR